MQIQELVNKRDLIQNAGGDGNDVTIRWVNLPDLQPKITADGFGHVSGGVNQLHNSSKRFFQLTP